MEERTKGGKEGRGGRRVGGREGGKEGERGKGRTSLTGLGLADMSISFFLFILSNIEIQFAQPTNQKKKKQTRKAQTIGTAEALLTLARTNRSKS